MDPEVKKQLDLRLARGEITREVYLSLQSTMTSSAKLSKGPLSFLANAKENVFGPSEMITPTDEHPLIVGDELTLFGRHLTHKGVQIPYSDIEGVAYKADSYSVNFVPVSLTTHFNISCKSGQSIYVGTNTMIFRGRKAKLIQNAYGFLRQLTFKQRMEAYLNLLQTKGYIEIGDVRVFLNGDIEKGDLRLNLKRARQNNAFGIGTSSRWGADKTSNPDEVIVGDKGTSILSKRIVFELGDDKDVLKALLHWLSEDAA